MKIGFVGPYCTANFGDWAMLINNMKDLGDNEYTIFTYNAHFPHRSVYRYYDNKIKLIEVKLFDKTYDISLANPQECLLSIQNYEEIENTVKNQDIIIVSGGGWINDNWCGRIQHYYKVMAPVLIASKTSIPIKFMAQGIGPINNGKNLLQSFFDRLNNDAFVAVRDLYESPHYLREVSTLDYMYVPDDISVLNDSLIPADVGGDSHDPYVLLVSNDKLGNLAENAECFRHFGKTIKNKYNLRVVILSFDLVWHGDEQAAFLGNVIDDSEVIEIKEKGFIDIETVYSYINNAKLLITERYHASVIAMQTHTPFVIKLDTDNELYAYNKAFGVLSQFMHGIEWDKALFIEEKWTDILESVEEDYKSIIEMQQKIFNSEQYNNNYESNKKLRNAYLQKILRNDIT